MLRVYKDFCVPARETAHKKVARHVDHRLPGAPGVALDPSNGGSIGQARLEGAEPDCNWLQVSRILGDFQDFPDGIPRACERSQRATVRDA